MTKLALEQNLDPEEKLHSFEQLTVGRPREIVSNCLSMNFCDGYKEARLLLKKRYGAVTRAVSAYVDKALA